MNSVLNTPWGVAKIVNGYYEITSSKEGYNGKKLHRLIWEDFYGCKIPDGYIIHHKNGNKLDNCILNLQLMRNSDHSILHNNSTGFLYVSKSESLKHSQGFYYAYQYKLDNGRVKRISSADLDVVYKKVKKAGLPWKIIDKKKAQEAIDFEINKEVVI